MKNKIKLMKLYFSAWRNNRRMMRTLKDTSKAFSRMLWDFEYKFEPNQCDVFVNKYSGEEVTIPVKKKRKWMKYALSADWRFNTAAN